MIRVKNSKTNGNYKGWPESDGVKSLPLVAGWNPYSTNMSYASGLER